MIEGVDEDVMNALRKLVSATMYNEGAAELGWAVRCVDNTGIEKFFDVGATYLFDVLDGDTMTVYDIAGEKRVCYKDRFRVVAEKL